MNVRGMAAITANDPLKQVQKRLSTRALAGASIAALLLLAVGERALAKGLVLGAVFSVLNFLLLGAALPFTLGRSPMTTRAVGLISIFFRYGVLAVPLIIAVKSPSFHFVTAAAGLFAVQIAALLDQGLLNIPGFRKRGG